VKRPLDDEPVPAAPWQWLVGVLVLVGLFDLALGFRAGVANSEPDGAAAIEQTLARAVARAETGARTILLIGDAAFGAHGGAPLSEQLGRELARDSDAHFEQIDLAGLLPVDALRLVDELDRLDPAATVELVIELDLADFAQQHAGSRGCSRPAICELGAAPVREHLLARAPVHRRRSVIAGAGSLEQLAVARLGPSATHDERPPEPTESTGEHAQLTAFAALLDRAVARGRSTTLVLPPLAADTIEASPIAATLVAMIHERRAPTLALVNLDHPQITEWGPPDADRLLAVNLLHELNLPLATRPFEHQIVHPEGHDRSLVHRVATGYADGGAWQALFDHPEGVAVSPDGARIIVADTRNHVLRELRGTMQYVETVAGIPSRAGHADGPARSATLAQPRAPELIGDAVWFIDGHQREALRSLERGVVQTPSFTGPRCAGYRALRAREGQFEANRPPAIWALCDDDRLLHFDLASREATLASELAPQQIVAFDLSAEALYFADTEGRLWTRALSYDADSRPTLGDWHNLFANTGKVLLPHGRRVFYPFDYDELRLAKVVDLRWVERYGALLVADEFPIGAKRSARRHASALERSLTERVHLRLFDLEARRILPWFKALPHAEAYALRNDYVDQTVSYWHRGSMAVVQADASLVWLERDRSRLFRVADGVLGAAKTGNHHTPKIAIPLLMNFGSSASRAIEAQLRPDRHLDARHERLAREGPYVALLVGSSLSSMSDRFSNYSFGRRLELELQRELGYRDKLRFDLFQVSAGAASFGDNINNFSNWMSTSVPPDVLFIEAHDFGGGARYLKSTPEPAEVIAAFDQLQRLAARYDTLVVFYDMSSIEANRRDGLRSTDTETRDLLAQAKQLGFVVLDPGDRLVPELLIHSPWANQPFVYNEHHGSTWAVDLTAQTVAAMIYPRLREFLRGRTPARERERPPEWFEEHEQRREPLRLALAEIELDRSKLAKIQPGFVQTEYVDRQLRVHVDLAGFADHAGAELDALAVAVIDHILREDVYADLAESLRLEFVEFRNYDEYGDGVVGSARPRWSREFDRSSLEEFLRGR
jgi:hypothetical protein